MTSRYRIKVNSVHLDSISKKILILDIGETMPDLNFKQQSNANLNGYEFTDVFVGQRTVTVTFEIHEYDIEKRKSICQEVNEWAAVGGRIDINDRGKTHLIRTECTQYASIESAKNWTDPLTVVFSTTVNPYWISDTPKTVAISGAGTTGTLKMDGDVGYALVDVEVTAATKITMCKLICGNTKLVLKGFDCPKNKTVDVDYIKDRYLRLRANDRNAMPFLQSESSDNLLARCGKNNSVEFSVNGSATVVFSARGCWL